ncbi:LysE family transporter [Bacteroidetes bacterium endosymbiont of Geopemphigus sp.]|uniref:LysE family transporter n=1 Tax=Bacteroidetes bacterium endosymbiont of Geopemphigus sp. TaxID=2047937 RepID=UPI0011AEC544
MENITDLSLFLISSLLLIISPDPDFVYVINSGIEQGKIGISSVLGVALGLWIHSLLTTFGLSSLL